MAFSSSDFSDGTGRYSTYMTIRKSGILVRFTVYRGLLMGFLLLSVLLLLDIFGATLDLLSIREDIYAIAMCHNLKGRR
jgi:hypothetical protein